MVAPLAFDTYRDGGVEIYVMNADSDGSEPITLTNDHEAEDSLPAWSPDGKQIAFTSNCNGNANIYVMDADGSNQRRLTDDSADDKCPAWSPDGKRPAFFSCRGGSAGICLTNDDGTHEKLLAICRAQGHVPAWEPRRCPPLWPAAFGCPDQGNENRRGKGVARSAPCSNSK